MVQDTIASTGHNSRSAGVRCRRNDRVFERGRLSWVIMRSQGSLERSSRGKVTSLKMWPRDLTLGKERSLEAELGRRVLQLKARLPPGIRNWESYLAKMLLNKANDWVDARRREERMVPILEGGEEEPGGVFIT